MSVATDGLEHRAGLPAALRVLADALPRSGWQAHDNFDEVIRFWLDRHLMFRELARRLRDGNRAYLDRDRDGDTVRREATHYTSFLLRDLHVHHTLEDTQFFPRLSGLDSRLTHGFDLLEQDHDDLGRHLEALRLGTNDFLAAHDAGDGRDAAGRLETVLGQVDGFLDRHLLDEEDLVVPVILTHAPDLQHWT